MQALELARKDGDAIKDQIWRELARAKCAVLHVCVFVQMRSCCWLLVFDGNCCGR